MSGVGSINYSITNYDGQSIPPGISFNADSNVLEFNAIQVPTKSSFELFLAYSTSDNPSISFEKYVFLSVVPWNSKNWDLWKVGDDNTWETCSENYILGDGSCKWISSSTEIKTLIGTTEGILNNITSNLYRNIWSLSGYNSRSFNHKFCLLPISMVNPGTIPIIHASSLNQGIFTKRFNWLLYWNAIHDALNGFYFFL